MMGRTCGTVWVLATTLVMTGCGGPTTPELAPVTGRVSYRGIPLSSGLIVFTPDDESGCHGSCAVGTIGADGRYVLSTDGVPGAAPGRHRVTVAAPSSAGSPLPDHFRDPQLSGLRAQVTAGRGNTVDFGLEDR
jgi:hypothetical protein